MKSEPTVYIVDDDEATRDSMSAIAQTINVRPETFSSAEDFLDRFDSSRRGCLVTDLRMMGMSGTELQEKLIAEGISIPLILITAFAETTMTVQALKRGAITVLEKPCRDYELVEAIRTGLDEDARIRVQDARRNEMCERLAALSPNEREVLELMINGFANKVIAHRLNVSLRTIESRRQRVFEKMHTRSLVELVHLVVELCEGATA